MFKKGNKKVANNYRLVSLTSIIAKIMEYVIRNHIVEHMMKNKLFSSKQFGFIFGRSTSLQLLKVLDIWTEAIDNGYYIDCIYMDITKAFDKVPHRRLMYKLNYYGINGSTIKWVEIFYNTRPNMLN